MSHPSPKLSVAIPLYNAKFFIEECLRSVITQETEIDYEIVVSDDASTDGSLDIVKQFSTEYPRLFRVYQQSANQGMIRNVASLALKCRGEYIMPLDADDKMCAGKIDRMVSYLDENPDCVMAFHELSVIDADSGLETGRFHRDYYNRRFIPDKSNLRHIVMFGNYFLPSSVLYRRAALPKEGFHTNVKLIEDFVRNIQVASKGGVGRVDEVLGEYRVHRLSATQQTRRDYERRLNVLADQVYSINFSRKYGVEAFVLRRGLANSYLAAAIFMLRAGEFGHFRKVLEQGRDVGYFSNRHRLLYWGRYFPRVLQKLLF